MKPSIKLSQRLPVLQPGKYRLILTAASGSASEKIVRTITIEEAGAKATAAAASIEDVLNSKALRYSLSGFLLIIAAILSWHNLVIVRKLPKGHHARKRVKVFYLVVVILAFFALAGFAGYVLFDSLQQIAASELNNLMQSPIGKTVQEYIAIAKGTLGLA